MNKSSAKLAAVSVVVGALVAGPAITPANAAGTVKIGVVEMITGGSAFYGQSVLEGIKIAQNEINKAGAEVLTLGCAGMSGLQIRMAKELGVPVVDGVGAAVKLVEGLVDLGLKTSKIRTYAYPLDKARPGWPVSEHTN